ncbi:putative diphthamide synthesis protein-domain-containing protein [Dactylonectria macrodidyma]|uniref:2-(3-amino-3-carboxypropyl)histidine synthase subunit 2 n=1 Tax=Dactylonectria macrodidyma TaxID=307937 RepID=A0A9P9JKL2_9HYPO|nr:putative diphthamide synthesis protein-domain-containing protein [Dactylonectria macrodidyma]
MPSDLAAPPVLSTPDDNILEIPAAADCKPSTLSDDQLRTTYEIARTAAEVAAGGWRRVGLQFPDFMLVDAPRVVEALEKELGLDGDEKRRIYILADSSYSACCVDEIAAEHVAADVVVHYGRTCLSPTSRLPAIYVYTNHELDYEVTMAEIEKEFGDKETKLVVMADLTYQDHVAKLVSRLNDGGYMNVVATDVVRDPAALIPNRTILGEPMDEEHWRSYSLIHISDPPAALLLALQSRFASLHILSTPSSESPSLTNPTMRTAGALRRRFAKVLSLASAGVIGILVNTLSVANYLSSIKLLRDKIDRAGKKSYTVVVGKLNPAKLANFAEVEGWVVVGCWESGLVEDDASYWRPVITPFELEVALMSEEERVWGGEWWGGIEKLSLVDANEDQKLAEGENGDEEAAYDEVAGGVEGEESEAPEFDLRTGKLISHSRPMRLAVRSNGTAAAGSNGDQPPQSAALVKRAVAGELASINGVASPGAEFLRTGRTWTGLGTDFDNETSTLVEEGRSGIARGYHVGEDDTRH